MSDVTNSCVAEACSGGQYEQWNTCTEAGMASSQDDCPDGAHQMFGSRTLNQDMQMGVDTAVSCTQMCKAGMM